MEIDKCTLIYEIALKYVLDRESYGTETAAISAAEESLRDLYPPIDIGESALANSTPVLWSGSIEVDQLTLLKEHDPLQYQLCVDDYVNTQMQVDVCSSKASKIYFVSENIKEALGTSSWQFNYLEDITKDVRGLEALHPQMGTLLYLICLADGTESLEVDVGNPSTELLDALGSLLEEYIIFPDQQSNASKVKLNMIIEALKVY